MSFTDELLTTLAAPRPTEKALIHNTTVVRMNGTIEGYCRCGWYMESLGTDESSRNAVKAGARKHAEDSK